MVDRLAQGGSGATFARKFDGLLAETEIDFHRVLLLKPETFMNLSGRSVGQAMRFYKLDLADLLVVCDDLNLPLGKLRIRGGGSDGGQKGLRDISAQLGTDDYARLRIGIGERGAIDAADFVLSRFRSRRTPVDRRRPDPRRAGRRRLGRPRACRRRHEPIQRARRDRPGRRTERLRRRRPGRRDRAGPTVDL